MREGISNSTGTIARIVWSAAVLVTIGLSILLTVLEWFATFDACVANPTCNPGAPTATLDVYLALIVIGVGLAVGGVTIVLGHMSRPRKTGTPT
jgi:hypothetical protein